MNFIVSVPLVADVHPVHTYRRRPNARIRYGKIRYLVMEARIPRNDLPVHVGSQMSLVTIWLRRTPTTLATSTGIFDCHLSRVLGFTPRLDVLYTFPITL